MSYDSNAMTNQLIVDDSITYLQLFKRDLQARGYGVEVAVRAWSFSIKRDWTSPMASSWT